MPNHHLQQQTLAMHQAQNHAAPMHRQAMPPTDLQSAPHQPEPTAGAAGQHPPASHNLNDFPPVLSLARKVEAPSATPASPSSAAPGVAAGSPHATLAAPQAGLDVIARSANSANSVGQTLLRPMIPDEWSHSPISRLEVTVDAPYSVIDDQKRLWYDKRAIHLALRGFDSRSEPAVLPNLRVGFVFEDMSPLPAETKIWIKDAPALRGGTRSAQIKFRIQPVSSSHDNRAFRFTVQPIDPAVAQAKPDLAWRSEPFYVKHKNIGMGSTRGPVVAKSGVQKVSLASAILSVPRLRRRRYFPREVIQQCLASTRPREMQPLTRAAVGAVDRLAATITQELLLKALGVARRREAAEARRQPAGSPAAKPSRTTVKAADVAAAVKCRGVYDFLHRTGVMSAWDAPEPPASANASVPGADAEPLAPASTSAPEADAEPLASASTSAPEAEAEPLASASISAPGADAAELESSAVHQVGGEVDGALRGDETMPDAPDDSAAAHVER